MLGITEYRQGRPLSTLFTFIGVLSTTITFVFGMFILRPIYTKYLSSFRHITELHISVVYDCQSASDPLLSGKQHSSSSSPSTRIKFSFSAPPLYVSFEQRKTLVHWRSGVTLPGNADLNSGQRQLAPHLHRCGCGKRSLCGVLTIKI